MHPTERAFANSLARLRDADVSGPATSNAPIVPGVSLSWDPKAEGLSVSARSAPGMLLEVDQVVGATPRWLELHLALGRARFVPGDVMGLVLEVEGLDGLALSGFVRTFLDDGFLNTPLAEAAPDATAMPVRAILHTVASTDPIVAPDRFHTLILTLPARSATWSIRGVHLFVLPAGPGIASAPPTLRRAADLSVTAAG